MSSKKLKTGVKDGHILGIGNPLLDISAVVEQDLLDKYEVTLNNAILADEKHKPIYEELVKQYKVDFVAGGATQNSIRIASWLLRGENPRATRFIGSVGKDCEYAETLKKVAGEDGVEVIYHHSETHPTGTCAVLVKDGERSLIANLSAANEYDHAHTESEAVQAVIKDAEIYYAASFFLTVPQGPKTLLHIAEHANKNGKTFAINLSAPFLIDFFHDPMMEMIKHADYVFCNESEAAAFAKKLKWDENDLKGAAKKIAEMEKHNDKPRTVVFTQGSEPTIVYQDGKTYEFAVDPLPKEKLVDTNGAGDSFVGGFLAALAKNKSLEDQVNAGHFAAKEIIQQSGCTIPKNATLPF